MKVFIFALLPCLLLLNAGCGALGKGADPAPPATPAGPPIREEGTSLRATLKEGATPQSYTVTLSWAGQADAAEAWTLYRDSVSKPRTLLGNLEKEKREFVDTAAPAGERVTYTLSDSPNVDTAKSYRVEIAIPRDLEVTGNLAIKKITGIHRLFLRKGARVAGQDGQLEIDVDQIISEVATVATHPEEDTAPPGQIGRTGEYLVIRAKRGAGLLYVVARGQRGGPGLPGAPGTEGKAGIQGTPFQLKKAGDLFFNPLALGPKMSDVVKAEALIHPANDVFWAKTYACDTNPGDGTPGLGGGKGTKGLPASIGGNAGHLLVRIENPAGIQIAPLSVGGGGGVSGPGGPGGKGGAGGAPGERDPGNLCEAAKPGQAGPPGPVGDPGEPGLAGAGGLICLKLGPSVSPDCDKLPQVPPFSN